jgi:hypothetical protein
MKRAKRWKPRDEQALKEWESEMFPDQFDGIDRMETYENEIDYKYNDDWD